MATGAGVVVVRSLLISVADSVRSKVRNVVLVLGLRSSIPILRRLLIVRSTSLTKSL